MAEETQAAASQPVPDPEALKPAGLSNSHKRYVYYGVTAALAALILANVVGSNQRPGPMQPKQTAPGQRENPSPAQIRDWENSLKQAEAQLEREQKDRDQQIALARASQQTPTLTPDQQIAQAEALQEARQLVSNISRPMATEGARMRKRSRNHRPNWRKQSRPTSPCSPTTWSGKNRLLLRTHNRVPPFRQRLHLNRHHHRPR